MADGRAHAVPISHGFDTPPGSTSPAAASPRSFGRIHQLASSLFASSPPGSNQVNTDLQEMTMGSESAPSSTHSSWRLRNPMSALSGSSHSTPTRHGNTQHSSSSAAQADSEPIMARIRNSAERLSGSFGERFAWTLRSDKHDSDAGEMSPFDVLDEYESDDDRARHNDDEGIDDEACFVDGWEGKVDFLCSLPHEVSLYILLHLDFRTILTVSRVSRQWRSLTQDNVLWRDLFHRETKWRVREDLAELERDRIFPQASLGPPPYFPQVTPPLRRGTSAAVIQSQRGRLPSQDSILHGRNPRRVNEVADAVSTLTISPSLSRSSSSQSSRRVAEEEAVSSSQDGHTTPSRSSSASTLRRPTTAVIQEPAPSTVTSSTHVYVAPPSFSTPVRPSLSRTSSRGSSSALSSLASSLSSLPPSLGPSRRASSATIPPLGPVPSPSLSSTPSAPLYLDWPKLYRDRYLLDQRWGRGEPKSTWFKGHTDSVYCIQFDDRTVISGSRDQTIRIWDLRTGSCVKVLTGHQGSVLCLQSDSNVLISGSSDSRILMWDLVGEPGTGKGKYEVVKSMVGHSAGVLDLCFNDKWIASCSKDTTIRIWHRQTGELYRVLAGHRGPVNAVQLCGDKVVSASGDSFMKMWDVTTGEVLRVFAGHERGLACVKLSASGKILVSGSNDRSIKIWDADTGECLRTLQGHTDLVRSLALDEHHGRIVSASYDRTTRVWDLGTGEELHRYKGHSSLVFDVAFSVTRIISSSHDQKILSMDFGAGLDTRLFV